ncbi:hypothetical protein FZEAL_7411 [Fusarium zealandicum]|uniref:U3 snorna associated n=1 Tax=Fusarium zealandicum TaxID=1053134 RepID=A0A8H4XHV1_9HYPO|nr:hypothetical protein FZEAL_7411 [Fusarium zealandicum]
MAPGKTRKRKSAQDLSPELSVESSASEDTKKQHNLPVRAKDDESAKPPSASAKGTMMVFGDDDNQSVVPAPAKPAAPAAEEEDEDDSDDEAPEAVSTTKVSSDIKRLSQAAQKAAQEQAASQKRKRRERDALFKQQAEERKKIEEEAKAVDDAEPTESLIQQRRTAKAPNLLPAEFLTDSSSEDEDAEEDGSALGRPRKRRIATVEKNLARQDRGPGDERVGSTVYRVAKKVDERMAPKSRKHSQSSKDILMRRNRGAAKPRSGFFVK